MRGTVSLLVLGPVEARRGDEPIPLGGPRPRALLARLALAGGRVVQADTLVEDLWDGDPPRSATNTLQTYVSLLRRALGGAELLVREGLGYRLAVDPQAIDAKRFEDLVTEARRHLGTDPARAADLLAEADALWRGPALADAVSLEFAHLEALRLEELRLGALEDRMDALLSLGRHGELVPVLERAVADHPLRERLAAQLVVALYRSGRQADALRAYERTRRTLADELGLEPGPELRRLEEAVLAHDPSLATPGAPPAAPSGSEGGAAAPAAAAAPAVQVVDGVARPFGRRASDAQTDEGEGPVAVEDLDPIRLPLPAAAEHGRRALFVGRDVELQRLTDLWADNRERKRVVVLAGEPGIGKTRLAAAFAAVVHDQGSNVLWGRCSSESLGAYQPLVDAFRELARHLPRPVIQSFLAGREVLGRLLPNPAAFAGGGDGGASQEPTDGGTERLQLFEAAAGLVHAQLAAGRVLLVIDDAQWMDAGTAALLKHVVCHPDPGAMLVVMTARNVDLGEAEAFVDLVTSLRRDRLVDRIDLSGLDAESVAALAEAAGGTVAADRVEDLVLASAGNPFYVEELASHLAEATSADHDLPIPDGIRDILGRRLDRLGDEAVGVLAAGAVLGLEVDLDAWGAVTQRDADDLLDVVDLALEAGLLVEDRDVLGRFAFPHAMVRQALQERLSRTRQARLHLRTAEAIADLDPDRLTEIANHRLAALPAGDARQAADAAVAAGHRALARLGFEEAEQFATAAAAALHDAGIDDPARWAQVRLLSGATMRCLGRLMEAVHDLEAATAEAREARDPQALARAALELASAKRVGIGFDFGVLDHELVAALEEALAENEGGDPAEAIRLQTALALSLYHHPDAARTEALAAGAVQRAEELGDQRVLARALLARSTTLWRAARHADRHAVLEQAIEVAEGVDDRDVAARARTWLIGSLIEAGDVDGAERAIRRLDDDAEALGERALGFFPATFRVLLQLLRGEYDKAEVGAHEIYGHTWRLFGTNATNVLISRQFVLAYDRHGFGSVVEALRDGLGASNLPALDLAVAVGLAAGGEPAEARRLYDQVLARDLADDALWLTCQALLADLSHRFGDQKTAALLIERLTPYADRLICASTAVCLGSAAWYLGLCATTVGDLPAAERWFEQAAVVHERIGARSWLARTWGEHAAALSALGGPDDQARAEALQGRADALAAELGMREVALPVTG